jgi:hypothetical protein
LRLKGLHQARLHPKGSGRQNSTWTIPVPPNLLLSDLSSGLSKNHPQGHLAESSGSVWQLLDFDKAIFGLDM